MLLLDADEHLSFANSAATRLVPDAVGLSLPRLDALLGTPAVAWLQAAQRGEARAAEPPLARLPDGNAVRAVCDEFDRRLPRRAITATTA